jgi:ubiquinone/menaquinone biosynthesis C-methylase UbiE
VALASAHDFSRHRRVLDLGGGTGSFLLQLLRRNSGLKATLFELPGVCTVARQRLAREPEGDRIQIITGNFLTDPLPDGHDAVLIANTIHLLSAAHNIELLRRTRERVSEGSHLLLVDLWTDASRTQPPSALLSSGEFLVISGEGQTYSEPEANDWLAQTGWRKLERKPLSGPVSMIVAEAV